MANLRYSDKHNMVAFLKKPTESVGFTKIVYFLKGTSLRYALTHNPTIYDFLVKQFWQTTTVRTLANGIQELVASVDNKVYTITKASIRSQLQLADATGIINLSDAEVYEGLATLGGYVGEHIPLLPAMLAGVAEDQGEGSAIPAEPHHTPIDPIPSTSQPSIPSTTEPPHSSPPRSHEAPLLEGNISGSAEDSLQLKELMAIKVKSLKVALKRMSKRVILSDLEDEETENQGRKIQDIDDDPLSVSTYKRRTRSANKDKDIGTGMDFFNAAKERLNSAKVEVSTEVNPSSAGVNTEKAPMTLEDVQATQKIKEQIRQLEFGLAKAMRLQALQDEEDARHVHLDALLAKRI
ncbi:hypothetical protein Tco_0180709 [Tanacetum coccineum]